MKKILAATIISALIATPAVAAVPGAYVALDVQSWSTTNNAPFGNPGMGLRIGAGYRFHPNVGVEVNYGESGNSSSVLGVTYKVKAAQLAVVGTYPVNPQIDVFAKLGMSANSVSVSAGPCTSCSKTDLLFGIGGQYNFTPNWGARLMYENLGKATNSGTNDMSASTISLGAVYAF